MGSLEAVEDKEGEATTKQIDFVTMGMFIIGKINPIFYPPFVFGISNTTIDDIDFIPPKPPVKNILGGAGAYSALGARLFSPGEQSTSVGWIIDKGSDFPESLTTLIESWKTTALFRYDPDRLTTRGWNGYEGTDEKRAFKYITPKKRLTCDDLTPELLQSRSFHLICSPLRCQQLVQDINAKRKELMGSEYCKPIYIWEPVPDLCTPDELLNCTNTLPLIDVCSPNHSELAGFMADDGLDPETGEISVASVERACEQLLGSMPLQSYSLVIRAGEKGCYIAKNGGRKRKKSNTAKAKPRKQHIHGNFSAEIDMEALLEGLMQDEEGSVDDQELEVDPGIERWIPAYHHDASKVVDPTGGGNTFLGGMSIALARGEDLETAAIWGSVAASFAIEQVGVPTLGEAENGKETWNEWDVLKRAEELKKRL